MKSRLGLICNTLKISYSKTCKNIIAILIAGSIMSIILGLSSTWFLSLISFVITFSIIILYLGQLNQKYDQIIIKKEREFLNFYKFLQYYLDNNYTLLDALKEVSLLVGDVLLDDLNVLINNYEYEDSLIPFIEFSNKFENEKIKQLIIYIYKYNYNGYKSKESNDNLMLDKIENNIENKIISKNHNELKQLEIIPLAFISVAIIIFASYLFINI